LWVLANLISYVEKQRISRLDDKDKDIIVLVMQRLHTDDAVSHVHEKEDWTHTNLPAVAKAEKAFTLSDSRIITRSKGDLLHPER